MQTKAYSIKDKKAEIFHPPFYKNTHGEAERAFHQLVNDEKSTIHKYPEDFELYYVGEFNDITGQLKAASNPESIIHALEIKQKLT